MNEKELEEHWNLSDGEKRLICQRKEKYRLIFAVRLKFFGNFGYSIESIDEITSSIIEYIAQQISSFCYPEGDYWGSRSYREHSAYIREHYGFRTIKEGDLSSLKLWLRRYHLPLNPAYPKLEEVVYKYFYKRNIEPKSKKQIERYLKSWVSEFEAEFFQKTAKSLSFRDKNMLDDLLKEGEGIRLYDLKKDTYSSSIGGVMKEIERISYIKTTGILSSKYFEDLSQSLMKKYHDYVMSSSPSELLRYKAQDKKYALLACFCYIKGVKYIDSLVEILLKLVHKLYNKGKNKTKEEFWKNRRTIYNKDKVLKDMAVVSIEYPSGIIEEKIYPKVGKDVLEDLANQPKSFDEYYNERKYHHMRLSYITHYRRIVSLILGNLDFDSKKNHKILQAVGLVKKYINSKIVYYPCEEEVVDIASQNVRKLVTDGGKTQRINYEMTLLKALRTRLRCKDIWINGGYKYRNPDKDLAQDFQKNRKEYYETLNKPISAEEFILNLEKEVIFQLGELDKNIVKNKTVKIVKRGGKPWIKVSSLKPQQEPKNIQKLKEEVSEKWPSISLLDILKETELRLDLTSGFTSVASKEVIPKNELQYKILLCIFALATNTGLKRVSNNVKGITYEDLKYVQRRFVSVDNIKNAIIKIINGNLEIRDKELFGGLTISCASDSRKFSAWDQNLMTQWHVRYKGAGIMVYWHVDRKALCVYSKLKSCSSSEVVAMIEGVIHHCTNAEVKKNYVDSNGQSLIGFAFSHLLDFSLLPRLKRIGEERLLVPKSSNFKNIQSIISRTINWDIIRDNYEGMIKYAIALKLRITEPEALLKRFTANNLKHPIYQALQELGRVVKTVFLCKYLRFEELRREIHEGLNVVERWNSVNDFIYYGKKSTISSNEEVIQKLSILSLHLLQASIVYMNTLMLQKVLKLNNWKLRLTQEDKRAISPLFYHHINPYGEFKLNMSERIEI